VPEELHHLGKLPAIIYPINQKIVFDYLYDQYKDVCSAIDIACYEKMDKVARRLDKYIKSKTVNIIQLKELGDLGRTIYDSLIGCDEPVIINFADTIINDNIYSLECDSFFYAEDYYSNTWTFFEEKDGDIISVLDKNELKEDDGKKHKLFSGVFQIMDAQYFRECLRKALMSNVVNVNSFYQALQEYSKRYEFLSIKTNNWFDIGHADKYYNSKLEVKAREFNHISIDKDRSILRKISEDVEKFIGEIKWYLKLPAQVEYVRPRIFEYSTSYINPYVSMEYYSYHTVHELFLYSDLTKKQWIDIFNRIRFVCSDFKRYSVSGDNIQKSLKDMYLDKTFQRFNKLRKDPRFTEFFSSDIQINGVRYKSLDQIEALLSVSVPRELFDITQFNIIHGDLCFANIMVDNTFSFIKVIDPRGKFGDFDIYGDYRYELAKLFHSVDGKYDFIIKDLFTIKYDPKKAIIDYIVQDRKRDYDLYEVFYSVFKDEIGSDLKKIELIEALLFLSMIPLHGESLNHQMAMLATGLEILGRVVPDIYC
ncbi:TPA: capsular biosynthesis protein, partial [Enterococcus faecium]|nr:capsular biosynthesis protein [Enterococcus faecium]